MPHAAIFVGGRTDMEHLTHLTGEKQPGQQYAGQDTLGQVVGEHRYDDRGNHHHA